MKRKQNQKTGKNASNQAGFTLIELSMVIIILSITLAAFGSAFMQYLSNAREKAVQTRIEAVEGALSRFLALNGRYPCPASLTAAPDTATFGVEISTNCSTAVLTAGTFRSAGTGGRRVRIGGVPSRTLNLPDEYATDAWAMRLGYAVTEVLASPGTFQQDQGAIAMIDSVGNSVITPAGSAHYTVFSTGPDTAGAYTVQGVAGMACDTTMLDGENCNRDAIFRATVLFSSAGTASHYDDFIRYIGAQSLDDDLPSGAVVPFNLATCPPGWGTFSNGAGRTIVGTGDYAENYAPAGRAPWNVSATYALGDLGGFMTWRQNVNELAAHSHVLGMSSYDFYAPLVAWSYDFDLSGEYGGSTTTGRVTGTTGTSEPMENRQPYVALLYCQKL
jgi:prepilin-type N-terminal cleavage/methylation domain-containing protein